MEVNVLIVDDSIVMRKILSRSIRHVAGEQVKEIYEAGDGVEGLEALEKNDIAVIFSDVNMPNMSGLEFLRALNKTPHKDIPVIVVTIEGVGKTVQQALALGAIGFVRKPFQNSELQLMLQQALDQRAREAASETASA